MERIDALWMVGEGKIENRSAEVDDPGFGEVQVEIKACGICAWDIYLFKRGNSKDYPFRFGHEGAGIIRKVGPQVTGLKPGDKVMCIGGGPAMAQIMNTPAENVAAIPMDVSDYAQWVGEPVTCAINGIDNIHITPGDSIAVIGTGFMGLLTIQGLNKTLSGSIAAFDIDERRLELAREFGADTAFDLNIPEGMEAAERIKAEGGVDIVVETSSTQSGLDLGFNLLKKSGKMSLFGWHKGPRNFDGTQWHFGGFRIYNTSPMIDKHYKDHVQQTAVLMRKGVFSLSKLVTHTADYSKAQNLFETASSKGDGYIKGVITF